MMMLKRKLHEVYINATSKKCMIIPKGKGQQIKPDRYIVFQWVVYHLLYYYTLEESSKRQAAFSISRKNFEATGF